MQASINADSDQELFPIQNLDRDGHPLRIGDRVGFVMRGWFLPRQQESFGLITEISNRGSIKIEVTGGYRQFTSSSRVATKDTHVSFTHHHYNAEKRARVYALESNGVHLMLYRIDVPEAAPAEPPVETPAS